MYSVGDIVWFFISGDGWHKGMIASELQKYTNPDVSGYWVLYEEGKKTKEVFKLEEDIYKERP